MVARAFSFQLPSEDRSRIVGNPCLSGLCKGCPSSVQSRRQARRSLPTSRLVSGVNLSLGQEHSCSFNSHALYWLLKPDRPEARSGVFAGQDKPQSVPARWIRLASLRRSVPAVLFSSLVEAPSFQASRR